MWKTSVAILPLAALLFGGCTKVENPEVAEESCDLCHKDALSKQGVHKMHLSDLAMANFPFRDEAAAAYARSLRDTSALPVPKAGKDSAEQARQNRLLAAGITCAACHEGVHDLATRVDNGSHINGVKGVDFDDALMAEKFKTDAKASMRESTCENIPCHGAGSKGADGVVWNTSAKATDTLNCNSCHNTAKHKTGVRCDLCHFDVTKTGKAIHDFRKHINGKMDVEE